MNVVTMPNKYKTPVISDESRPEWKIKRTC